ncbi:MAG: hypothetical protein ABGZ24_26010, partial [Fuerstiella sp.]
MEHDQFLFVIVESPTWLLYVTLLLTAIFFRFSRLLTVRNLDLVLLLLLSTALVVSASSKRDDLASAGPASQAAQLQTLDGDESQSTPLGPLNRFSSFIVLALSVLLIVRLTFDESLTRRPRLEQNLNQAALTFLFFPAFTILMTGVFLKEPPVRN